MRRSMNENFINSRKTPTKPNPTIIDEELNHLKLLLRKLEAENNRLLDENVMIKGKASRLEEEKVFLTSKYNEKKRCLRNLLRNNEKGKQSMPMELSFNENLRNKISENSEILTNMMEEMMRHSIEATQIWRNKLKNVKRNRKEGERLFEREADGLEKSRMHEYLKVLLNEERECHMNFTIFEQNINENERFFNLFKENVKLVDSLCEHPGGNKEDREYYQKELHMLNTKVDSLMGKRNEEGNVDEKSKEIDRLKEVSFPIIIVG